MVELRFLSVKPKGLEASDVRIGCFWWNVPSTRLRCRAKTWFWHGWGRSGCSKDGSALGLRKDLDFFCPGCCWTTLVVNEFLQKMDLFEFKAIVQLIHGAGIFGISGGPEIFLRVLLGWRSHGCNGVHCHWVQNQGRNCFWSCLRVLGRAAKRAGFAKKLIGSEDFEEECTTVYL